MSAELPTGIIITPSYNQAAYLETTIRSVLDQNYRHIEYIFMDGGSTDGSIEIIKKYADRLAFGVSKPDEGQTDATNQGFARAKGEIIAWLNSDDIYRPGAISEAVAFMQNYLDVGLVYGNSDYIVGEVFDVAVDLRRSSSTFGGWVGVGLSAEAKEELWVPPGFAHGYYTLSDWAEVLYKVTDFYAPEWERTLLWNGPHLAIKWPLPEGQTPILSDKDARGTPFQQADCYE